MIWIIKLTRDYKMSKNLGQELNATFVYVFFLLYNNSEILEPNNIKQGRKSKQKDQGNYLKSNSAAEILSKE